MSSFICPKCKKNTAYVELYNNAWKIHCCRCNWATKECETMDKALIELDKASVH